MQKHSSHCPVCFEPVDDCMCTQYTVKFRHQPRKSPKTTKGVEFSDKRPKDKRSAKHRDPRMEQGHA